MLTLKYFLFLFFFFIISFLISSPFLFSFVLFCSREFPLFFSDLSLFPGAFTIRLSRYSHIASSFYHRHHRPALYFPQPFFLPTTNSIPFLLISSTLPSIPLSVPPPTLPMPPPPLYIQSSSLNPSYNLFFFHPSPQFAFTQIPFFLPCTQTYLLLHSSYITLSPFISSRFPPYSSFPGCPPSHSFYQNSLTFFFNFNQPSPHFRPYFHFSFIAFSAFTYIFYFFSFIPHFLVISISVLLPPSSLNLLYSFLHFSSFDFLQMLCHFSFK